MSELTPEQRATLVETLLHKEGNWVDWGQACLELRAGGVNDKEIFEETGFQESQQNLIVVATQVFQSIAEDLPGEVKAYFAGPRSDVIYELRILNQQQRLSTAQFIYDRKLDLDASREVAKSVQKLSRLSKLPEGFTEEPGDAMAYFCWKWARQKSDLRDRSRLIAEGLKYSQSDGARMAIEKLLQDFTVVKSKPKPQPPFHRLEEEEELSRIIPLAHNPEELTTLPRLPEADNFGLVTIAAGTYVTLPGWQVILKAIDPVGILSTSDVFTEDLNSQEQVLVLIDRGLKEWNDSNYFAWTTPDQPVEFFWSETAPADRQIIGQILVIIKPKRILDENNLLEPWQMDD
jgi:hypothetical protein